MNYVTYTYYKILFCCLTIPPISLFQNFRILHFFSRTYFGDLGVFCIINWYFECDIRILCLLLYIWSWKNVIVWRNVLEVWTVLVRNILGDILGIWGPKWSPYDGGCQGRLAYRSPMWWCRHQPANQPTNQNLRDLNKSPWPHY